jgi:hypothetical protein
MIQQETTRLATFGEKYGKPRVPNEVMIPILETIRESGMKDHQPSGRTAKVIRTRGKSVAAQLFGDFIRVQVSGFQERVRLKQPSFAAGWRSQFWKGA